MAILRGRRIIGRDVRGGHGLPLRQGRYHDGVSRKLTIAATPQVGSVGPGAEQDEIEKIEHVVFSEYGEASPKRHRSVPKSSGVSQRM